MQKRKCVFYGDSNTYGFDPRGFICGRYPEQRIWTFLVADAFGGELEVINQGMNGRQIPAQDGTYAHIDQLLSDFTRHDLFTVMLGSNDLLVTIEPDAKIPLERMDRFLGWLLKKLEPSEILLLAPPLIGAPDAADPLFRLYYQESGRMNEGFAALALKHGVWFEDTGMWQPDFAFDGVHLSEEGHRRFAERLIPVLKRMLTGSEQADDQRRNEPGV